MRTRALNLHFRIGSIRRWRRASVLILVVALLALLALIGTAFLSTARMDRYSARQATNNIQIDMLLEGASNMPRGFIGGALFDATTGGYRPALDSARESGVGANTYGNWTYAGTGADAGKPRNSAWLADRVPVELSDANANTSTIAWKNISWNLMLLRNEPGALNQYDVPNSETPIARGTREQIYLAPTAITIGSTAYPAFQAVQYNPAASFPTPQVTAVGAPFLAADADGDGIADAGYYRLPTRDIDGLRYYAAVRIIDNNSAINFNTAWSRGVDFAASQTSLTGSVPVWGFFPSNIGLMEMLGAADLQPDVTNSNLTNMDKLHLQRTGNAWSILNAFSSGVGSYSAGNFTFTGSDYPVADPDDSAASNTLPAPPSHSYDRSDFFFLTQGEALFDQLTRRIDNPGYNTASAMYSPLGLSDSISLASRFVCIDPNLNPLTASTDFANPSQVLAWEAQAPGLIEQLLPQSLYLTAPRSAYAPSAAATWYNDNFRPFDSSFNLLVKPLRSILTARNPVNVQMPSKANTLFAAPAAPAAKVCINTASFNDLWRGFYNVMTDQADKSPFDDAASNATTDPYYGQKFSPSDPFTATSQHHPARMFRTPMRPNGSAFNANFPQFPPSQIAILRSAIAAANAEALRDPSTTVLTHDITIKDKSGVSHKVTIYGNKPQPFITEVFACTDMKVNGSSSSAGYVAVELYNPYSNVTLDLSNYQIQALDRTTMTATTRYTFPPATFLPPRTYLVVDNQEKFGNANAAKTRPGAVGLPQDGTIAPAPGAAARQYLIADDLGQVIGKEMLIRRPRIAGDTANVDVPIDSYDFTGLAMSTSGKNGVPAQDWHYMRGNVITNNSATSYHWRFVYPGRYDGNALPRQQGTDVSATYAANSKDPWDPSQKGTPPTPLPTFGGVWNGSGNQFDPADNVNTTATYPKTFTIQLFNDGFPGPSWVGQNAFPFGGFARNGDILEVPFIGAYRIYNNAAGTTLQEVNAITMDSVFAEDTDVNDDVDANGVPIEQIGRFCPLYVTNGSTVVVDDHDYNSANRYSVSPLGTWRYHWAASLFDYFTVVQHPADDLLPDRAGGQTVPNDPSKTATAGSANVGESAQPTQGLININTASAKVLSMLPMVVNPLTGKVDSAVIPGSSPAITYAQANNKLAAAIVYFRDVNCDPLAGTPGHSPAPYGPFHSIMDINRVTNLMAGTNGESFVNAWKSLTTSSDTNIKLGDLTPYNASYASDSVYGDFEYRYGVFTRLSNLITTQSDSFTVYVVLEGWKNAGTANAQRMIQRRNCFIIDRSGVTATVRKPASIFVSSN